MAGAGVAARRRNLCLLAAGCAWFVGGLLEAFGVPDAAAAWPAWARIPFYAVLLFVIANVAVLGPILAFWLHLDLRALTRFRAATDIVARWTVSHAQWAAFLAEERRIAEAGWAANTLDTAMACPPEGLACVATRDGVRVGEDFHAIPLLGQVSRVRWIAGPPLVVEIRAVAPRGGENGGLRGAFLRIPFGEARKAAQDVHAAWSLRNELIGNPGTRGDVLRRRRIALAVGLAGVALMGWIGARHGLGTVLLGSVPERDGVAFALGFLLGAIGLALALRFQLDGQRAARVVKGRGVVGRWTVPATVWRDFRAFDAARRVRADVPFNLVDVWQGGPVRVTVAEDAVQVGPTLFHIPSFAAKGVTAVEWLEGPPACIEIRGVFHARIGAFSRFAKPEGDWGDFCIRVPVVPSAERAARQALQHWEQRFLARA